MSAGGGGGTGAFSAVVRGRVQGVGFRYSAMREARRLMLCGRVANNPDGTVSVYAEGDAASLERFAAWLKKGPPGAAVTDLELHQEPFTGRYFDFSIDH